MRNGHSLLPTSIELLELSTISTRRLSAQASLPLRNTTPRLSGNSILTTPTLTSMAHLDDDDESHPPDLEFPIVRLLVTPFCPIMEFTMNAGPNSTANGVFLFLYIMFWFGMSSLYFCKALLDDTFGDALVCSWFLCYLAAAFCYCFLLIANQLKRDLGPNTGWTTSEGINNLLSGTWWCFTLFVTVLFTPYIRIANQSIQGFLGFAYYTAMGLCLTILYVGCPFFLVRALLDPPFYGIRWDHWWLSCRCFFASCGLYCLILATTGQSERLLWRHFTAVIGFLLTPTLRCRRILLTPYSFLITEAGGSGIVHRVHAIFVCLVVTCFILLSAWLFYLALLGPGISDANRIGLWLASIVSLLVGACMYALTLATAIESMEDQKLLVLGWILSRDNSP